MKTLTVIVPTYNMEAYLERCINSITEVTDVLPQIQVIIVNDGSSDRSAEIAHGFETLFPDSIRVIDKPNGNYGSTINAALPIATGKYIKILDADDSFNTDELPSYIRTLDKLPLVDMVVSPFTQITHKGLQTVHYDMYSRRHYRNGRLYSAEQIFADGKLRFFMMHSLSYRTEMLRQMDYRQTEGISYTDLEWGFYPLTQIRTVAFAKENVYRYDLTREGQTMDPRVQLQSITQLQTVTDHLLNFYEQADKSAMTEVRIKFLKKFLQNRMCIILRMYLMQLPERCYSKEQFDRIYAAYTSFVQRNDIGQVKVSVNRLLSIDLMGYMKRHGHRPGTILRSVLMATDSVMNFVYRILYR